MGVSQKPLLKVTLAGMVLVTIGLIVMTVSLFSSVGKNGDDQSRLGIAPEIWRKFDPGLQKALATLHGDPTIELPVMIALEGSISPPLSPQAGAQNRKELARKQTEAFESEAAANAQELTQHGARDIQFFWINRTLSARVALPALQAAARRPEVKQIVLAVRQPVMATPNARKER